MPLQRISRDYRSLPIGIRPLLTKICGLYWRKSSQFLPTDWHQSYLDIVFLNFSFKFLCRCSTHNGIFYTHILFANENLNEFSLLWLSSISTWKESLIWVATERHTLLWSFLETIFRFILFLRLLQCSTNPCWNIS
jgi:hypothetical protein